MTTDVRAIEAALPKHIAPLIDWAHEAELIRDNLKAAGYAVVKTELLRDIEEELSLIVVGEDQPDTVAMLRKQIASAKGEE